MNANPQDEHFNDPKQEEIDGSAFSLLNEFQGVLDRGDPAELERWIRQHSQGSPDQEDFEALALLHAASAGAPTASTGPTQSTGRFARSWQWCKRNPKIVLLVAINALTLMFGTAMSTYDGVVRVHLERKIEKARGIANAQAGISLSMTKAIVEQAHDQLDSSPRSLRLRKDQLEQAIAGLTKIAELSSQADQPKTWASIMAPVADMHQRLGTVYEQLGEPEKAYQHHDRCLELLLTLTNQDSRSDRDKESLAVAYFNQGRSARAAKRDLVKALGCYQASLDLREELYSHLTNSDHVRRKERKEAIAASYAGVGATCLALGKPIEAQGPFRKAIALREEIVRDHPADGKAQLGLIKSYQQLSEVCSRLNQHEEQEKLAKKVAELNDVRQKESLNNLLIKLEMARWYLWLGETSANAQQWSDAQPQFWKAVEILLQLADIVTVNIDS